MTSSRTILAGIIANAITNIIATVEPFAEFLRAFTVDIIGKGWLVNLTLRLVSSLTRRAVASMICEAMTLTE